MTQPVDWRRIRAALPRHLSGLSPLLACHALIRRPGQPWEEAARLGSVDPDQAQAAVDAFDEAKGGSLQALAGGTGQAAWLARYAVSSPGLDLCLLFYLGAVDPKILQERLGLLEDKVGWLLVAGLSDLAHVQQDVTLSAEIGATLLLEAAAARSRGDLADQWIARLEKVFAPDAIAVCWVRHDAPQMSALSGGVLIERPSQARTAIETLAQIAIRARTPGLHDTAQAQPAETRPDPAIAEAITALGATRAMCLPVYQGDPCSAVVVLLWTSGTAPLPQPASADLVAQILGESMAIQARAHPSLIRRMASWTEGLIRAVFGLRFLKLKLVAAAAVLTIGVLAMVPSTSRPAFSARIEARDRIIVSAPFDGFLTEAELQLGDSVRPGDLLVAMEDTDFRLEFARAEAERNRLSTELQSASAARDTARVRSLDAQIRQLAVQLDLLTAQLDRARLVATTTGVVVGGDAWRRVGGRVRLGEPLLELANPESLAVMAFIDESWVADVPDGARATMLLAAWPNQPLELTLLDVTTDAQTRDGVNSFAAWLRIDAAPDIALLDSMRGIVRIDAGPSTLLADYSRGVVRWIRRAVWQWS